MRELVSRLVVLSLFCLHKLHTARNLRVVSPIDFAIAGTQMRGTFADYGVKRTSCVYLRSYDRQAITIRDTPGPLLSMSRPQSKSDEGLMLS